MHKVNLKKLKPYGDRMDDGAVQLSFTLPVKPSPEAKEAARRFAEKLNLEKISVTHMESMGGDFTFFIVYGTAWPSIDITKIKVPKLEYPELSYEELKDVMNRSLEDRLVVVGACTGSDAHTVGIDAILNMKGFNHDYGLERYPKFEVHNLRSQLSNRELVDNAVALKADALLVSQVVTQRESHVKNLKELKDLLGKEKRLSKNLITIVGGPRIDQALAVKLGFDAGFGPGTKPSQVASFILKEYLERGGRPLEVSKPAPEIPFDEEAIDEETIEDSYTPLVYQKPVTGQIRQQKPRRPRRGKRGGAKRRTSAGRARRGGKK
jgi:beta-lysine 5,6-aminomutase beta subunit